MKKYICTKSFAIEKYDDNGFWTGDYKIVDIGDIYHATAGMLCVAAPPAIRLESDNGEWLELLPETVAQYFSEEVDHDRD